MVSRALLLVAVVLTAQLCACTAYAGSGGDGFSVEFIHRDSVRSPFHDATLTAPARVLEAVRRSAAHAAALSRSYVRADAPSADGVVSPVTSRSSEYLMAVNIGTPPTRMFDPYKSTTFGVVDCNSGTCRALHGECDANSKCTYIYSYADDSRTSGLLSTETFTFADAPGARGDGTTRVANVNFGCSTTFVGTYIGDGIVGLGGGDLSLVSQLGTDTSLGRRFSYCLVPYSVNASSALNFGPRAAVTDPGAVTTPLIPFKVKAYYIVELQSLNVGNATFAAPDRSPPPEESSLLLCFDVSGVREGQVAAMIPEVTLGLGGGAAVTLKAENTFFEVQEGTLCLAVAAAKPEQLPASIIGNIAQQNMHVGYDLDKGTVTFAPADCASSYPAPSPSGSV
ncbi:hypothetical protein CFC21_034481 [Triticum aestivum]|uniref:Peptidase A1 domain-containing protein n=2 Tax=Triticum aestivum TaxID=4565 RepID=A0A3B6EDC4_WHEAT|nr:hypothetical protein CFC21_034481 [Triticum aestivum]